MTPFSDPQIIQAAEGCRTYAQLASKLRWTNFQSVVAAADRLKLGLKYSSPRTGKFELPPRTRPKPQGKGTKPKGGTDG